MGYLLKIGQYLSYPFVQSAFFVAILVAVVSSLFGTTLVLKRFSFIGDGLSHTGFGAMAFASCLGVVNKSYIVLPIMIIFSILLLKNGKKSIFKGDAYLAIISASSLAIGYLLINKFPSSSNISADVCSTLFGSTKILMLSTGDVVFASLSSIIIGAVYVLFYNKIFAVTSDENFAHSTGLNSTFINTLIAILIAVIITLAMKIVGSLLISAFITFPPLSAMRLCKSYKSINFYSAIIAGSGVIAGLLASIILSTPTGATVVAVYLLIFLVSCLYSKFKK